jgi:DNA repair protein RadC
MTMLYVRDRTGFREADSAEVFERAQALLSQRYRRGAPVLTSPDLTREFLRMRLGGREYESFGLIHLDARYRLLEVEDLFRGTIDRASVHPREVIKSVLSRNSAAVIFFHNHVSHVSEPSSADELITRHLREALATLDVKVVDHLIIADPIYSFAEHGRL